MNKERAKVGDIIRKNGFPKETGVIVVMSGENGVSWCIPQSRKYPGKGTSQFVPHGEYEIVLTKESFERLIEIKGDIEHAEFLRNL